MMMNTSYPHTSSVTLPIITYSEVEQYIKDWMMTGRSDYLQHVPKNELMAHCYMVGVEKQVIKQAYLSNGKDELIKALISTCPIVGSSNVITEDLQTFLNRSHDLYCIIHAKGRINSVRKVDTQLAITKNESETRINTQLNELSSSECTQPLFVKAHELQPSPTTDLDTNKENNINLINTSEEINSPELSSRPRRKIRTSPKDKYRLKEYKKRLAKTTANEMK